MNATNCILVLKTQLLCGFSHATNLQCLSKIGSMVSPLRPNFIFHGDSFAAYDCGLLPASTRLGTL